MTKSLKQESEVQRVHWDFFVAPKNAFLLIPGQPGLDLVCFDLQLISF
jgi:hypothetical protein